MSIFSSIAAIIIARAIRTPYKHLRRADGSLYMARYWLRPYSKSRKAIAVRVHNIASPDRDRAMHDHPWWFISIVLHGGYAEARPKTIDPCFDANGVEEYEITYRLPGSVTFRLPTDRHRIIHVLDDTWTLFITGPTVQWWGFYTPAGKIYWRDFGSQHEAILEDAA